MSSTTDPANAAELEHDDRGRPERDSKQSGPTSESRTLAHDAGKQQPASSGGRTVAKCDESVYGPDEQRGTLPVTTFDTPGHGFDESAPVSDERDAATSGQRTPGCRCDEARCDTEGHELAE